MAKFPIEEHHHSPGTDGPASSSDNLALKIPASSVLRVLRGVATAAKVAECEIEPAVLWVTSHTIATDADLGGDATNDDKVPSLPYSSWCALIKQYRDDLDELSVLHPLLSITIAVAWLREGSRCGLVATPDDLEAIWACIREGLCMLPTGGQPLFTPSRSAQGFLAVPLCSLLKDGNIDELIRFHVWLPDGQRGNPDFAVHSHQPFAQSWILAGEVKDCRYAVERDPSSTSAARHAEYAIAWSGGKGEKEGTTYKTQQAYSIVVNTGRSARVDTGKVSTYTRDMTYSVPAGAFHSTQPAADLLYATFFYFDSSRGFDPDARVLGPSDGESFTQHRDPAGVTAPSLVRMVQAVRSWAAFLEEGRRLAKEAKWESALHAFDRARSQASQLPDAAHYRRLVLAELGNANRRFGRYQRASEILEALIAEVGMEDSPLGIEVAGELGVIYRHMNRLIDARRVLQGQYDAAARLGRDREACRALGNLGMVNYQLFLRQSSGSPGDDRSDSRQDLLSVAVEQLTRRVEMARRMREALDNNDDDTRAANAPLDARTRALFRRDTLTWESVGLARLSLCRAAHGDTGGAVEAAKEALRLQEEDEGDLAPVDPNVLALGRFFYGRALWADGQTAAARAQLDPPYDAGYRPAVCTPAIALCKEPSEEHSGYLRELVAAGVDMDRIDDAGYSALDYAVFGGDKETQDVVLEGLGKTMDEKAVRRRLEESRLRKAYRELYQERLREVLLKGGALQQGARHETVQELRHVYATALGEDQDKAGKFDVLKYVPYPEFEALGRLPRSTDGLARPFTPRMPASESDGASSKGDVFIIFFSYRWLGRNSNGQALPDDTNHTQYRRMMRATDGFLALHPELDKQGLGVWLDYACVDQDDPARGVAALPMLLAQCDAVISLHDDLYYTRAWCSVETLMVQTLKKSYGLPLWYEEIPKGEEGDDGSNIRGTLRHGPMDMKISLAEKHITFESDRPKVLFLERQTRLLG